MTKVRFRLDFIVEVPTGHLPMIDPLDVIEHGVRHASVNAVEILPGARCSTTIATRPMSTTVASLKRFGKITSAAIRHGRGWTNRAVSSADVETWAKEMLSYMGTRDGRIRGLTTLLRRLNITVIP